MPAADRVIDLPYAFGSPPADGLLRQTPEDFQVDEDLGFAPEGEGEHLWVWLEKRGMNTDQVARQLARLAGVKLSGVSYAGLKDRHAVTRQWFSIHLPKFAGDPIREWRDAHWRVVKAVKARRKIRRGSLRGNHFIITLREARGDKQAIEMRLKQIAQNGVPNYFGEQRFGHNNIAQAEAMARGELQVTDRHLRGIFLSSLRSALFNVVLARRVDDHSWNQALPGEAINLDGSRSFFVVEHIDASIVNRLAQGDAHPTGPLWGLGELPSHGAALMLERSIVDKCPEIWLQSCIAAGMEQERRPLRLIARHLTWAWPGGGALTLAFSLTAGAYATAVLREIVDYRVETTRI
jgi:tRNA pseudouridine13 synthase